MRSTAAINFESIIFEKNQTLQLVDVILNENVPGINE